MPILEAVCHSCGETFMPLDEVDLEHIQKDDGTPCGGEGIIIGSWVPMSDAWFVDEEGEK